MAARCDSLNAAVTLHDAPQVAHQIALAGQGPVGQAGLEFARQGFGVAAAGQHRHESLHVRLGFGRGQGRLILDGVGNPAQQVGIRHRNAQLRRQLRNRQGEGSRDVGQYLVLIDRIGNAGVHADSISKNDGDSTN